ncbi:MAG TPA: VOC family protein [Acidobacteriota bacterium]
MTSPRVTAILETCLYCPDLAAAEDFYVRVLGLELFGKQEGRHLFFRCGDGMLLLFNPKATRAESAPGELEVPPHGAEGPGHVSFRATEAELEHWRRRLTACGVAIESEVAWPGGGRSIYFRDPAGNSLELATPAIWGSE